MFDGWRCSKWGDEVSLQYGKAIRGYQNAAGSYRVFGSNGPVGWHTEALAPGPGVILGRKGAYRGVRYSRDPFFVIDTAYYLQPKTDIDMRWLYYAVIYHRLGEIDDGSPIPSTTRAAVYVRDVEVPPLCEQKAIAEILGSLDDKIELNRRMNETLEAMAQAIFRDWFVDFGPTRRKLDGATDPVEIMGGLVADPDRARELAALFPAKLGDDGLPEGWVVGKVGDVIDIFDSKRIPLSAREREVRKGPYPYHGATGIMDYVDNYLFDEPLLLLGEDGSVAKSDGFPYTQYVWEKVWVNNHAHVLRGSGISTEQLKLFFDQTYVVPFVTGAVQPKLNQRNLIAIPFLRADSKVHEAFDDLTEPIFAAFRARTEETRTLAATRDLLLPKLISGEIRLSEDEANFEAA
jgi:type I restriction enzyme S subunit